MLSFSRRFHSNLVLLSSLALLNGISVLSSQPVRASAEWPANLRPLVSALERAGYRVLLEKPPIPGAYGATNSRKKMIWVAPISIDLGIAKQTLIHEAVHAAQGCPTGKMTEIGWTTELSNAVDREIAGILYRNYPHAKFSLEREAFGMQANPQAFSLISQALTQRCSKRL